MCVVEAEQAGREGKAAKEMLIRLKQVPINIMQIQRLRWYRMHNTCYQYNWLNHINKFNCHRHQISSPCFMRTLNVVFL